MESARIIRVTGKGRLKIKPDLTRITLTLTGTDPEYERTLRKSAEHTDRMKQLLSEFGFEREDLKTLQFDVDAEYDHYRENGDYKSRFMGYQFRHTMKVEFPSDRQRLGKILYALANSALHPEFEVSYTVQDAEAAKNTLLGKAVRDAKEKAAVLTQAAGVRLGQIASIDYSWGEITLESRPMNRLMQAQCLTEATQKSYDLDIEPDDVDVSDTVTVVWEIG